MNYTSSLTFDHCILLDTQKSALEKIMCLMAKKFYQGCVTVTVKHKECNNEPAHEIMVLITKATSEGSGEFAHPRSLNRAFAVRTPEVWK